MLALFSLFHKHSFMLTMAGRMLDYLLSDFITD